MNYPVASCWDRASDFPNLNEANFGEFNTITYACLRADTHRQKNLCNLRNLWIKKGGGYRKFVIICYC